MTNLISNPFVLETPEFNAEPGRVLSGLKLAVKDLFHVKGLTTTAGNPSWPGSHSIPSESSSVVLKLIDDGALLVGKTITDELAYSLNGINVHYGTPINQSDPDRIVGGSSSGSAAAVAAGLADIGLGTDTGGSIRVPASYNGLYGLRPTHGVVATDNMVGLAPSFDTVGWLTRDLKTLQKVTSRFLPTHTNSLKELKIGFADEILNLVEHGPDIKRELGKSELQFHNIGEELNSDLLALASDAFRVLQGREIWNEHGEWIQEHKPVFADDIHQRFEICSKLTSDQEQKAKEQQAIVQSKINALLREYDAILFPTTPGPAPYLNTASQDLVQYRNKLLGMTALAGLCGLPQLHVPIQSSLNAHCGFSLIAAKHQDLFLLDVVQHFFKDGNDSE